MRDKLLDTCPKCGAALVLVSTAYGWRAICTPCSIRWTYINGEEEPQAERHSPMADNTRDQ